MLCEQLADDEIDLRTGAVVEESARIGHHATVDGCGEVLAEVLEAVHLPDDAEHQFAGTAGLWLRDGEHGGHRGVEVVVDEHLRGRGAYEGRFHLANTARGVVVETEHEVGNLEEHVALLGVTVVAHNLLRIGHPVQEVGILIGHDNRSLLTTRPQILRPAKTRADGVAVGTLVAGDEYVVSRGYQLL